MSGTFSTMLAEARAALPAILNTPASSVALEHCPDHAGIEIRRGFRTGSMRNPILVLRARLPYALVSRAKDGAELAAMCVRALEDATKHAVSAHPEPLPPIDNAQAKLAEIVRIVYGPLDGPIDITDLADRVRARFT